MANLESYMPILPVHVVRADDSSRIDFSASVSTSNNLTLIAKQTNDVNNTRLTLNNTIVDAQIDYVLANKYAVFLAADAAIGDRSGLFGGIVGIGLIKRVNNLAGRFDVGYRLNFNHIEADYSYHYGGIISDYLVRDYVNGYQISRGLFGSFTVNSLNQDRFYNFFIRAAYSTNTLLTIKDDINNQYVYPGVVMHNFNLSGGVTLDILPGIYAILGLHYNYVPPGREFAEQNIFLPFIRLHYAMSTPKIFHR
ncbi:hypothetical protein MASR1M45_21360 [Candidatus Kapaibacterium sp.]